MSLSKNNVLLLVLIVAVGVAIALTNKSVLGVKSNSDLPTKNQALPESVNGNSGKPLSSKTVSPIEEQTVAVKNEIDKTPDHVKADTEIRKKWLISRGYTYFIESDEYKNYSKDTLEKLSNSGDIRAMDRLAKILEKAGDSEKAKSLYKKAAVYGSTSALGDLSAWAATESMAAELVANDSKAAKANVIESMAYLKAAYLRGDSLTYSADMMVPQTTNPRNIQLNENDYANVKIRAQQIYDDLQKQRYDLGLGEFDNSVPPEETQITNDKDMLIRY